MFKNRKTIKQILSKLCLLLTVVMSIPGNIVLAEENNVSEIKLLKSTIGKSKGEITILYSDEKGDVIKQTIYDSLQLGEYLCTPSEIDDYTVIDKEPQKLKITLVSKKKVIEFKVKKNTNEPTYSEPKIEPTTGKTAIVLGGGASWGAYEIGAWKAINELGIKYDIVVGASIGSVNGALMATNDYDKAYELWSSVTVNDITTENINISADLSKIPESAKGLKELLGIVGSGKGADITPFENLLKSNLDLDKLYSSDIQYGLITLRLSDFKGVELTKDQINKEELIDYIIASSSIYPVFPIKTIGNEKYLDGGLSDNVPIEFARKLGATNIIAIDLSPSITHKEELQNEDVTYIQSPWSLGSLLDFDQEVIQRNMELGYNDTMKALGHLYGYKYTFSEFNSDKYTSSADLFTRRINRLNEIIKTNNSSNNNSLTNVLSKDIDSLIAEGTKEKTLDSMDIYLRGAEISGEALGLEATAIYKFDEFKSAILKENRKSSFIKLLTRLTELTSGKTGKMSFDASSFVDSNKDLIVSYAASLVKKDNADAYMKLANLAKFSPESVITAIFRCS